jgi:hypothetical protein
MDHSEEYYKMKYLKYKSKYFELKNNLEGGEEELKAAAETIFRAGQGTGRALKYVGKSLLGSLGFRITPKEERAKIGKIIKENQLTIFIDTDGKEKEIKKDEKGKYEVRSFLDNLYKKIVEENKKTPKNQKKIDDLNYVYGKHYMCKGITTFQVYDQKDCFPENQPTNQPTN